jgi:uncharacterized protein YgbK (DUF1537 family)
MLYSQILQKYPQPPISVQNETIREIIRDNKIKIVVIDDDPTGIQTVHGCLVITAWDQATLESALCDNIPFFYVFTNSRALLPEESDKIYSEIVSAVCEINKKYNYNLVFISRSDSTLRGHFPLEPFAIKKAAEKMGYKTEGPIFFIPAFLEAGRFTIDNTHYLKTGDELTSVNETEFARDNIFGYKNAYLPDYVVEKSKGQISISEITALSLTELRSSKAELSLKKVTESNDFRICIINALDYSDLYTFAYSVLKNFNQKNKVLVMRTSSSLPKAISGITNKPLLTKKELVNQNTPGIFIVGSHVKKTSLQLENLLKEPGIKGIEIDASAILEGKGDLLRKTLTQIKTSFENGFTPVLYTSRVEIRTEDKAKKTEIGKTISTFLVNIVRNLPVQPSFLVAKGGITSSDILTKGLEVKAARVQGQIITGVPVIITNNLQNKGPLPYIIFPGNVGDENSLAEVFKIVLSTEN